MSTKAEEFRYWLERSGPKKEKRASRRRGENGGGFDEAAGRTRESRHADRKATYALEDSVGRPSRLSTRKSSNHQKTDGQMRAKRWTAEVRPETRAGMRPR